MWFLFPLTWRWIVSFKIVSCVENPSAFFLWRRGRGGNSYVFCPVFLLCWKAGQGLGMMGIFRKGRMSAGGIASFGIRTFCFL